MKKPEILNVNQKLLIVVHRSLASLSFNFFVEHGQKKTLNEEIQQRSKQFL